MQKIVCNQCGGKWYVDNADITQMKCCLYCQKPLRQKKEITTLDTLDKVIFKAVSSLGMDALSQPRQLAGYMMDIAPEFKRELRILTRTLSDEYYTIVRDAFTKDIASAELLISKLRTLLIEDDGLSESWADVLCNSYMGAIRYFHGIGLEETLLALVENYEPVPVVFHTSAPSPKQTHSRTPAKTERAQDKKAAPAAPARVPANYRCQVCGYRIDDISSNLKCPLCKAQKWESTNAFPKPASKSTSIAPPSPTATSAPPSDSTMIPAGLSVSDLLNKGKALVAKKEYIDAAAYLRKAAQKGNAEAAYELGKLFQQGNGVQQDIEIADDILCESAKAGYVPAYVLLGKIRYESKKYASAWKWFHKAIEQNDPTALYYAFLFYKNGYHVTKNEKTATRYLDQAIKAGSAEANLHLAKEAHAKNEYGTAISYFLFAATQGNAEAQYYLGKYFSGGKGTKVDLLKAAHWYKQAADQGHEKAKTSLQNCINAMSLAQRLKWN
ncbi:MAG: hypothetical protein ACI3YU_10620 [Segatella copri]